MQASDVPVFILCGGFGTRFKEETMYRPKPMIPIGEQPILWHIMGKYARHGFQRFVLCLGYKGEMIRSYFGTDPESNDDLTLDHTPVDLSPDTKVRSWQVTLTDTGSASMTGARLAMATAKHFQQAEHFAVTYGDGLTDADLSDEFNWHKAQGRTGTVLGVNPPSRFGEFKLDGDLVVEFNEKPRFTDRWINAGFFFFKRTFVDHLDPNESCVLERAPLAQLAKDQQLAVYKHEGFWACMDTRRDQDELNQLWESGDALWT